MGLFSCFLQIALQIALQRKVSKWIHEPVKRALLVTVFQTIMDTHRQKCCSMNKMFEFCNLASKSNLEPGDFMELQELLQEISNMESHDNSFLPMRRFLGHRPIIGGTRGNYWNRAKMQRFLLNVNGWNGTQKGARSFRNTRFNDLTSDDIRLQGHNGGGIREVEILQTAANDGKIPVTQRSSSDARSIPLTTPRSQWKEAAAHSVGSTPLNTPRGGHGSLASSSSSVGRVTSLNTLRGSHGSLTSSSSSVGVSPLNSPRGHLCTAPPPQKSLIIEWFMTMTGQSFNSAMKEVCKGLTYQNDCLVQIFKVVQYFQTLLYDQVLNSSVTRKLFFEKLSLCALIQRTIDASPLFRSIKYLETADELIQMMFLEGLVSSFYQEAQGVYLPSRQYILGISKITPKQDGNFLIELLPEEMIQDYLNQFRPSTIGEQPPMA